MFGYSKYFFYLCNMEEVKCIKCGNMVQINIAKAVDEEGEVFCCPHCGQIFRYVHK